MSARPRSNLSRYSTDLRSEDLPATGTDVMTDKKWFAIRRRSIQGGRREIRAEPPCWHWRGSIGVVMALALHSSGLLAADPPSTPRFALNGLLDLRGAVSDDARTWMDRGSGKLRYGGNGDEGGLLGRISELSILGIGRFAPTLSGVAQLQHRSDQTETVDLVQAFLQTRHRFSDRLALSLKGGLFFPPISLEHDHPAWATQYSITPSAINSWIGEEVRTLGVESSLLVSLTEQTRAAGTLALFSGNDPAGSILAWRGWALHDIKSGLHEELPLAPIPALEPGGAFHPLQAPYVEPFREIDDRVGLYSGVTLLNRAHQLRLLHYTNRADESVVERGQYAWDTRFNAVGLRLFLPMRAELNAQWMDGTTKMGGKPNGEAKVDDDFTAWYLLLTRSTGRHRVTLRYEEFEVVDTNGGRYGYDDDRGDAVTVAYSFEAMNNQLLQLEWLNVNSKKRVRQQLALENELDEQLWQLNYRVRF